MLCCCYYYAMCTYMCIHITIICLDNTWRVSSWPFCWELTSSRCQPCAAPCWVTGEEFPNIVRFTRFRHSFIVRSGWFVHQGDSMLCYWLWCSTWECHYANCGYVYHLTHALFSMMIIARLNSSFLIDAMVRPPCENGQVNSLINELLVHVGLIKVNSINLWTFLGTNFWELLIVWSCMIVYIIVGGQEIQASERYQRPNFGSEACGQARLLPSKFSGYTHRLLNEVSAKFVIEEVNTE